MRLNILIKTKQKNFHLGDKIEIRAIFEHPMKSGQGKDEEGNFIKPHFIEKVFIYYDDEMLSEMEMSGSVSSNPLIIFNLIVDRQSAPLRVVWIDNLGNTNKKEIALEAL